MSHIVSWEYYSALHSEVNENEFARYEMLAEKEICMVIGQIRWASITEDTFGYDQLKDCICNTVDQMAEDMRSGRGKGISGVSNDGYSESYTIQTREQLRSELHGSIRAWLSGTGLVGAY